MKMHPRYVDIRDLPKPIRAVLCKLGYLRQEISIEVVNQISLKQIPTLRYNRGFAAIVDLNSGKYKIGIGAYGGTNQYSLTMVDDCNILFTFPASYVVIKGEHGPSGSFAVLYMNPNGSLDVHTTEEERDDRIYQLLKTCYLSGKTCNWSRGFRMSDIGDAMKGAMLVIRKDNTYHITKKGKKFIKKYEFYYPNKILTEQQIEDKKSNKRYET